MTRTQAEFLGHASKPRQDLALALVALLVFLLGQPAPSAPRVFNVGMSKSCFRNGNRNDATAAYRVFLERSGRRFGNV